METSLVGTTATARDVLRAMLGRDIVYQYEERALLTIAREHDFSNPLAKTIHSFDNVKIDIEGNHLAYGETGNSRASFHILSDGKIIPGDEGDLEAWRNALEACGWDVEFGHELGLRDENPVPGVVDGRRINLRRIQAFGNHMRLLMCFRSWEPDGREITQTIGTRSHPDAGRAARELTRRVIGREKLIPGSPVAAAEEARTIILGKIGEYGQIHGLTPDHEVTMSAWRDALVEMTILDSMLEPERVAVLVGFRVQPDKAAPEPKPENMAELETKIRRNAQKVSLLAERGRIITSLGRAILGGNPIPQSFTKWRNSFSGDHKSRSRLVIRDGIIGGELIVEKSGKRILRVLNTTFELPTTDIPQSMLPAMAGRPLSQYVQHPLITDDMIIRNAKHAKKGIRGDLTDEGRSAYEAP